MTVWARAVRCLMALALAVSGALLPSRGAALADASTPRSVPATTANSAACAYDATAVAHADVHANDTGVSVSQQEVGSRQVSAPPSARVLGASTISSRRCVATNTADDVIGLADDYIDITAKGSRVRNVQTSVNRSSFEQNLVDSGYQSTVVGQGKNVVSYELNGTRYVVRDAATSTGGPTADFYPAGSASFTLKIRLAG